MFLFFIPLSPFSIPPLFSLSLPKNFQKTPFTSLLPTPEPEQQESETPPAGTIEEVSEESEESPKEVKEEAKKETKEESGKKEEETGGKKREVLDALDDSEITNDATSKEDLLLVD